MLKLTCLTAERQH